MVEDQFGEFIVKIVILSSFLMVFFYGLHKIFLWARGKPKGAFVLLAILPMMSLFPIPPIAFKNMEVVEKKQHKRNEDSGDPPDNNE